jgi:quaternary ammonium compound-resistance protein SugE
MSWIFLFFAGLLEIVWAVAMKQSAGFTRLTPTLIMAAAMPASFFLLAAAMRSLPLGTAYMIWTGIGAIGAFVVGVVWLGETATPMRVVAAILIAGGIMLMKLADGE